jgi:hypothetical protein
MAEQTETSCEERLQRCKAEEQRYAEERVNTWATMAISINKMDKTPEHTRDFKEGVRSGLKLMCHFLRAPMPQELEDADDLPGVPLIAFRG